MAKLRASDGALQLCVVGHKLHHRYRINLFSSKMPYGIFWSNSGVTLGRIQLVPPEMLLGQGPLIKYEVKLEK